MGAGGLQADDAADGAAHPPPVGGVRADAGGDAGRDGAAGLCVLAGHEKDGGDRVDGAVAGRGAGRGGGDAGDGGAGGDAGATPVAAAVRQLRVSPVLQRRVVKASDRSWRSQMDGVWVQKTICAWRGIDGRGT
jgi:hypothetical protein